MPLYRIHILIVTTLTVVGCALPDRASSERPHSNISASSQTNDDDLPWPRVAKYGPRPDKTGRPVLLDRITRGLQAVAAASGFDTSSDPDLDSEWKGVSRDRIRSDRSKPRNKPASDSLLIPNEIRTEASVAAQISPAGSTVQLPESDSDTPEINDLHVGTRHTRQDHSQPNTHVVAPRRVQLAGWTETSPDSATSPVPASDGRVRVPLHNETGQTSITRTGELISIDVAAAPVTEVLSLIARQHGMNVVTGPGVTGIISLSLKDVSLNDALSAILTVNGFTWVQRESILIVSRVDPEATISPLAQGRRMRVFPLTYVSGEDINQVVTGLLSPVGKSFATDSSPTDDRRTRGQIVVEDLPEYLARAEEYILSSDVPPLQVLIEAHILQVELSDSTRHGVDIAGLMKISGSEVSLATKGFANPAATPAFLLNVDGSNFDLVLEALKTTTDAKTLASPKVLAVNGQEATIQIGAKLGYLVTTTTQTSTLQDVKFLDTGVLLRVTPKIGADRQVLMTVAPEISSGRISPGTGLPEEETTEVETTVMLQDGQAMIIGGLISEVDVEGQTKIPIIGDLWGVGRLFQRRTVERERSEIIIALIPRVLPYSHEIADREELEKLRATTPLLHGPLVPIDRTGLFEAELPDAVKAPRTISIDRSKKLLYDLKAPTPKPLEYYFPTTSGDGNQPFDE